MTKAPMMAAEIDAGLTEIEYVTIPDVEICRVGMKWPASTGEVTLTLQHLADAVEAATNDPFILDPRLKLGHTDTRFNEEKGVWDPFEYHGSMRGDGTPAFGKVANLKLINDGAVVMGDYVEVPNWLANAAPSAYPSRSQEADWDIVTPGGKRYSMVITAVAMLGDRLPAIATLEDLIRLCTSGFDPAADPDLKGASMAATAPVAAAADIDQVIHQCWYEFCVDERLWWWPCSVWVDPNQVILDDDEGHLFRVPFTTDDNGVATFGDPIAVVQQFKDLPSSDKEPAAAAARPVASFSSPVAAGRPKDRVRPVAANVNEGDQMTPEQKALAVTLGLGEDATVEQLNEKLQTDALAEATPVEPGADDETDEPAVEANVEEPVAATVVVSKEVWEKTNARLGTLEQTNATRDAAEATTRRDTKVGTAISAGKIAAVEYDHYRGLMEIDEDKTTALLASLSAGRIPLTERGKAPSAQSAGSELEWPSEFRVTKKEV